MKRLIRSGCRALLFILLLVGILPTGTAGTAALLREADALARAGDFAPAYCIWQRLSNKGNLEAKYNLGWLYRNGQGVAVDHQQARRLWEQAARKGHGEAQMALGQLYSQSRSISRDHARAVKWYRAAARQGIEDALLILLDYMDKGDAAAADAVAELVRAGRAGTPEKVSVDKANVRERPSTKAKVVATLPQGTRVLRFYVREGWWRVWVKEIGGPGWMYQSLFN